MAPLAPIDHSRWPSGGEPAIARTLKVRNPSLRWPLALPTGQVRSVGRRRHHDPRVGQPVVPLPGPHLGNL